MVKVFNAKRKADGLPYRDIAECIIIYKDKVVAQDAGFYLSLPGGGIDDGETPEKGGKRELLEEVGVKLAGKLKVVSMIEWDWHPGWANNPKRKGRYMQFRGERVYLMIGEADSFIKPSDVDNDKWVGRKFMSFKKAADLAEKYLKQSTGENQYCYNFMKANALSMINKLHSMKILDV